MDKPPLTPEYQAWKSIESVAERVPQHDMLSAVVVITVGGCIIFAALPVWAKVVFAVLMLLVVPITKFTNAKTSQKSRDGPPDPGG